MKIVQLQMRVYEEKEKNLAQLGEYLKRTAHEQADIVTVGEMFTCPYQTEKFPLYAEREGAYVWGVSLCWFDAGGG